VHHGAPCRQRASIRGAAPIDAYRRSALVSNISESHALKQTMDRVGETSPKSRRDAIFHALGEATYWERRRFLWHKVKPRYPRFLYKYRSIDPGDPESVKRLREIVIGSRLWLSSPFDFNDPFDMSGRVVAEGSPEKRIRRFKNLVGRQASKKSRNERRKIVAEMSALPNEEHVRRAKLAFEQNKVSTGVCSFAGDPNSILMWSHYGHHHEGVCLQFEIARDPTTFLQALDVEYIRKYPELNWLDDTAEQIGEILLRKFDGWKYEEEHRIIVPLGAHKPLPFANESLTAIIFGCRATDTVKTKVRGLLLERVGRGMSRPALYDATRHPSEYALVIRRS
jgi:hypothetical protein